MKIGIVTFWNSNDNYGQLLQCYALQTHLRKLGHSPFLIRYKEEVNTDSGFKLKKTLTYITHLKAYLSYLIQKRRETAYQKSNQNNLRQFDLFRNKYLEATSTIYNRSRLCANPPQADAYVCGSDQIWGGKDDIYYLSFAPENAIKIAYAPSLGGTNPFQDKDAIDLNRLLKRFDYIGMREASGTQLLQQHGFEDTQKVIDPTLLLDDEDYLCISSYKDIQNSEAFVYLLGSPTICRTSEIFKFIQKNKWTYTYVASQGRIDKYLKKGLTIPEWLASIRESKIVITNSFHCVVFSLIFRRPFIFIPLSGTFSRMNDRLEDLLGACNLKSQIYKDDFQSIPLNIDFSAFCNYQKKEKDFATKVFRKYLS